MTQLTTHEIDTLQPAQLKDLAKRGIIRIMSNVSKPVGKLKYTDLPEYKKHARWKGTEITLREASRTFDIPTPTISRWTSRGLITILRRTNREIYLDKADVAYCAEIYARRQGAGNWLFNKDRTPHVPTTRRNDRP